jgi:hypothetical protein
MYVGLLSWGHFTEEIFSTIFPTKKGIFPSAGNTDSFTGFGEDLDYSNIDGEKDLFLLWYLVLLLLLKVALCEILTAWIFVIFSP